MSEKITLPEPIVVNRFHKNRKHDAMVTTLETLNGRNIINVRQYVMDRTGRLVPTSKGIAMDVLRLPQLASAINKALKKARALGLLDGGDQGEADL